MESWILTLIVFLPLAGMIGVLLLPKENHKSIRALTALTTFVVLLLTIWLWRDFAVNQGYLAEPSTQLAAGARDAAVPFHYYVSLPWIPAFSIYYKVGVDGLSVSLLFLTGLLSFLATFSGFSITRGVKGYYALYLLLVTGMMGVFVSLDLFLFYVFWELMLLPMYFLIGIWGGPRREYAAIKFFIYTLAGSVLILLAMLAFYFEAPNRLLAFDIPYLMSAQVFGPDSPMHWLEPYLFWGLFIGFAIKVPVFPFHTWLPDAHVEAPTAISVILAGVLLKMGGYGIIRLNFPLCAATATSSSVIYFLAILGFVSIVYGALCAFAQSDFKKLVAYSSVSHMGYVLLGIASLEPDAINGAIFQMFNHGLSSAMMFMLVGVLYERAHHREIARFGGIGLQMPHFFALSIVGFFAALGLPGLNGFISEALVFLGSFKAVAIRPLVVASALGIVLTACYILWVMQRVYLGQLKDEYKEFKDCTAREYFTLVPLALGCIVFGVWPRLMLDVFAPATVVFTKLMSAAGHALETASAAGASFLP
ncbi:MAG: NADH-quinone oxidoreductase subunit M [candidate division BRC1 bacterium ADurb.BinA364]|nr:MAG: NADH-quinone oxidoreductase subunit M [candidate division BRC1 bacterium ADurb.BinA364]